LSLLTAVRVSAWQSDKNCIITIYFGFNRVRGFFACRELISEAYLVKREAMRDKVFLIAGKSGASIKQF
jgi:hypothetical protein